MFTIKQTNKIPFSPENPLRPCFPGSPGDPLSPGFPILPLGPENPNANCLKFRYKFYFNFFFKLKIAKKRFLMWSRERTTSHYRQKRQHPEFHSIPEIARMWSIVDFLGVPENNDDDGRKYKIYLIKTWKRHHKKNLI